MIFNVYFEKYAKKSFYSSISKPFHRKLCEEMEKMKSIRIVLSLFILLTLILTAPTNAQIPIESTWVILHGRVDQYGAEPAFGWCGVYAEIKEWAQLFLGWTISGPHIPEICQFYAARLNETTLVELNYDGSNLYIEGLWNVYNVTFIYEPGHEPGRYTLIIEQLVEQGRGTLSVTDNWSKFTVGIVGLELIRGTVIFHKEIPGEIPIGDVTGEEIGIPDSKVDIWDLVHVAKAYGSTPRYPQLLYDFFRVDLNFDYKIDIYDLTTLAVNIGKSY